VVQEAMQNSEPQPADLRRCSAGQGFRISLLVSDADDSHDRLLRLSIAVVRSSRLTTSTDTSSRTARLQEVPGRRSPCRSGRHSCRAGGWSGRPVLVCGTGAAGGLAGVLVGRLAGEHSGGVVHALAVGLVPGIAVGLMAGIAVGLMVGFGPAVQLAVAEAIWA